jgi:hypothetical protein
MDHFCSGVMVESKKGPALKFPVYEDQMVGIFFLISKIDLQIGNFFFEKWNYGFKKKRSGFFFCPTPPAPPAPLIIILVMAQNGQTKGLVDHFDRKRLTRNMKGVRLRGAAFFLNLTDRAHAEWLIKNSGRPCQESKIWDLNFHTWTVWPNQTRGFGFLCRE